ncbi:MAG: redox-sensing transcriptional repressor Rex [Dehalococcoidia bacterium]|nr:redox-sensing transcriptional repressor Rex [Dehalococcoidia bacterium]
MTEGFPRPGGTQEVPEVVVMRLPHYLRALVQLGQQGVEVVSSQELGRQVQVTPAQIRKDLSYFGRFGKQGRGYSVSYLLQELRRIMGLDREWQVALVGVGRLGRALLGYPGFASDGFKLIAAFDADPQMVGQTIGNIVVQPIYRLQEVLRASDIQIAIVAVPASETQRVVDQLVGCNVQAILNYAPVATQVPPQVKVRSIDPVLALQSMTFYLQAQGDKPDMNGTRRGQTQRLLRGGYRITQW